MWAFLCPWAKAIKENIFAKSIISTSFIRRRCKCGAVEDAVRMCPLWGVFVSRTRVAGFAEGLAFGREVDVRHIAVVNVRVVDRESDFQKCLVEPIGGFSSVVLESRSQMHWNSTPEDFRLDYING